MKEVLNMEKQIKLRDQVIIKVTQIKGSVIGIWFSAFGDEQYNIRYYDTTGKQNDDWFVISDFEKLQENNQQ